MKKYQTLPYLVRAVQTLSVNSLSYFFPRLTRLRGPFFLNWQISYACNARCGFCNTHELAKQGQEHIDPLKVVEQINDFGICHLSITGGEPFLGNNLKKIIDALEGKNIYINVNTNGSLLHKHFDWLFDSCIDSLTISIDSADPQKHDANRSIKDLVATIKSASLIIKGCCKK